MEPTVRLDEILPDLKLMSPSLRVGLFGEEGREGIDRRKGESILRDYVLELDLIVVMMMGEFDSSNLLLRFIILSDSVGHPVDG